MNAILVRIGALLRRHPAEIAYVVAWKLGLRRRAPSPVHQALFTAIHRRNDWGNPESRSGPGSTRARGADIRDALLDLIERFSITSLLDAPCGDFNWMRDLSGKHQSTYIGVDVVEQLVSENQRLYGDSRHRFLRRDITCDALPAADLVLCRDALVHFSFADIDAALGNFKRSGSRYLLATSHPHLQQNEDIRTGGWRPLNLERAPFDFPPPIAVIDDMRAGAEGIARGKRLCLWKLADLSVRRPKELLAP
jgi:hypothetical protein